MNKTNTTSNNFYGTDEETFYCDTHGRLWIVQSPDLVGVSTAIYQSEFDADGAVELSMSVIDDDMLALAAELDAVQLEEGVTTYYYSR